MRMHWAYALIALLAVTAGEATAQSRSARLSARPSAVADSLQAGITPLGNGAFAYRPAAAAAGPLPLLVLFHGAGGNARQFLELFRFDADRRGYVLLALQSRGPTWEMTPNRMTDSLTGVPRRQSWRFGRDVDRSDEVLEQLFAMAPIDRRRVAVGGFSDGASYALSLGLANPELFTGIIALSPGFMAEPRRVAATQRIFISHGRSDQVLPFGNAQQLADRLERLGAKPRFRPFDGGHLISRDGFLEAVEFVFAP